MTDSFNISKKFSLSTANKNLNQDFNLDTEYIKCATTALIREYLARKGYRKTLEEFDTEFSNNESSTNISSRTKLIEYLCIQDLYEKNKKLEAPFKSILELLLSFHTAKFKSESKNNSDISKMDSKQHTFGKSSKSSANDLRIDDTNEGELFDGNEKRIDPNNLDNNDNKYEFNLKTNKPKTSSKTYSTNNLSKNSNSKMKEENSDKLMDDFKKVSLETNLDNTFDEEFERKLKEKSKRTKEVFDNNEPDTKKAIDNNNQMMKKISPSEKLTSNGSASKASSSTYSNDTASNNLDYTIRSIDIETAKELRTLLFGNIAQSFSDDWKIQNLGFCDLTKLKFGIVQKKGGPCGVLASIQAYILYELIYSNGEPPKDLNLVFNPSKKDRSHALAKAIAKLVWKCSGNSEAILALSTPQAHFPPSGKYRSDGVTETINLLVFKSFETLENYLIKNSNVYGLDDSSSCILVLYSAIFSRGIKRIMKDMDDPSSNLMGKHGYCTQDMVNLLIHGRAVSNVFNDSVELDNLELRGPDKRNDIGVLSLFEHYKSCEVGSYYKTPRYPIWVVCSESHFSVLFAFRKEILTDWKAESKFDLYYYDGLARQDEQIKLTISSRSYEGSSSSSFMNQLYKNRKVVKEKDLTPPLEHVIRTKWQGAEINWNGTTPIL